MDRRGHQKCPWISARLLFEVSAEEERNESRRGCMVQSVREDFYNREVAADQHLRFESLLLPFEIGRSRRDRWQGEKELRGRVFQ